MARAAPGPTREDHRWPNAKPRRESHREIKEGDRSRRAGSHIEGDKHQCHRCCFRDSRRPAHRPQGATTPRSSVEEVLTRSPATFGPAWAASRHFRRPNAVGRTAGATGGLDQRVEESTASDPTTSASCRHSRPAFRSGATVLRRSCLRSAGDRGRRHRGPASPERAGSAIEGIGFMPWTALQRKASDPLTLAPGSGTQSRERRNLTRHRSTKDCRCWPGIVGPGHNPIF